MARRTCKSCIFCDSCDCDHVCEYYVPTNYDDITETDFSKIDEERFEYYKEWFKYLSER